MEAEVYCASSNLIESSVLSRIGYETEETGWMRQAILALHVP
jgi:hypothetical protein